MATLIAVYNSSGCVVRCDAKCYDADSAECDCICGGKNHGAGKERAIENTRELAENWLEEYCQQKGLDKARGVIHRNLVDQFALFDTANFQTNLRKKMARPAKWNSSTSAIRVPSHLADSLLEIARSLDSEAAIERKDDPEMEAYLSFVQNSTKPKLLTVQDSEDEFKEHHYIVRSDLLGFEEWKQVKQLCERLQKELFDGLSWDEQLDFLSRLVQEVFPEHCP